MTDVDDASMKITTQAAGNAPPSPEAIGGKGKEAGAGLALGSFVSVDLVTEMAARDLALILQRQRARGWR